MANCYVRTYVHVCPCAAVQVLVYQCPHMYIRTYIHIDHTYCMHVHKSMHASTHVVLYSSENPMLKRVQHTIVRCLKAFMNNKVGIYIRTYVRMYVHTYSQCIHTYIRTCMYTSTTVFLCLCAVHFAFCGCKSKVIMVNTCLSLHSNFIIADV